MSYQQALKEISQEHDVPYTIWRDMDAIMSSVASMSHRLNPSTKLQILRSLNWDRETLMSLTPIGLTFHFQGAVFLEDCEDYGIKEENAYAFLEYWNGL